MLNKWLLAANFILFIFWKPCMHITVVEILRNLEVETLTIFNFG